MGGRGGALARMVVRLMTIPAGMRAALALLGGAVLFVLIFGDDLDRVAIGIGLLFALSMSGQEGLES